MKDRKIYKKRCLYFDKENRTCKQNEVVSHCIKFCKSTCLRFIDKRKMKDLPPVAY